MSLDSPPDIVIAGAGPGGLAAAQEAMQLGMKVTVYEASDRPGGRISTGTDGIDRGAELIHTHELGEYVRRTGLTVVPYQHEDGTYIFREGQNGPERDRQGKYSMTILMREVRAAIHRIPRHESMTIGRFLREWLPRLDTDLAKRISGVRDVFDRTLEAELGANIDDVSLLSASEVSTFDGNNYFIQEGYGALPQRLAEGVNIRYGQPVTRIERTNRSVTFHTPEGATTAPKGIVAVPIGILQREMISFDPVLPPEVLNAIDRLGNAKICKFIFEFRTRFWEKAMGDMTVLRTDIPELPLLWPNQSAGPSLTSYVGALPSHRLQKLPEQESIEQEIGHLENIFGKQVRGLLLRARRIAWNEEPWIYTGYSYVRGIDNVRQTLSEVVDGVLAFVGEAFIAHPTAGTVSGAVLSGQEQPRKLLVA